MPTLSLDSLRLPDHRNLWNPPLRFSIQKTFISLPIPLPGTRNFPPNSHATEPSQTQLVSGQSIALQAVQPTDLAASGAGALGNPERGRTLVEIVAIVSEEQGPYSGCYLSIVGVRNVG